MPTPIPGVPGHPQLLVENLIVPWEGHLKGVCRAVLEMGRGVWGGRAPGAGVSQGRAVWEQCHWLHTGLGLLGQVGIPSETPSQALKLLLQHLRQGSGEETGKNMEQPQMHLEYLEGKSQICPGSDPGSAQTWDSADRAWCPQSVFDPGGSVPVPCSLTELGL